MMYGRRNFYEHLTDPCLGHSSLTGRKRGASGLRSMLIFLLSRGCEFKERRHLVGLFPWLASIFLMTSAINRRICTWLDLSLAPKSLALPHSIIISNP